MCVHVRGFITGVVRRDVCSHARDESLSVLVQTRAQCGHIYLYVCRRRGRRGAGRARGDPFFSVSPVLSSHPFYARALLC